MNATQEERRRRDDMWRRLAGLGGPRDVIPTIVRDLGLYGGAAGVWVNAERTRAVDPSGIGVTVGLLHTGTAYPDDLDETGLLYHYPSTARPGHDAMEIMATKKALALRMPVFVITHSTDGKRRNVHRAFVVDSDDQAKVFLVSFSESDAGRPLPTATDEDTAPFAMTGEKNGKKRLMSVRDGQPAFKFKVLRRYGPRCAVCSIEISELLDAAHIREKQDQGSDDPRNGLVLCATHHRAFDRHFFAIEPETLLVALKSGMTRSALAITRDSLLHLTLKPHPAAIGWRWQQWQQTSRKPTTD